MFLTATRNGPALLAERTVRAHDAVRAGSPDADARQRCARSAAGSGATSRPSAPADGGNVFDAAVQHVRDLQAQGKRVIVAAFTPGARERLATLLAEHELADARKVESYAEALALPAGRRPRSPCSASSRASRPPTSPSSASRTSWATGWCGRGARRGGPPTSSPRRPASASATSWCTPTTASAASTGSPPSPRWARRTTAWRSPTPAATSSTCRSRTSSCCRATARPRATSQLDRLGGVAWQTRKARLKQRIREIAAELIKIAALRQLRQAPGMAPPAGRVRRVRGPLPLRARPRTRRPASTPCWTIWPPASRWTGWCAATSASARPRWRCGRPSSPRMDGFQVAVVVPTTLLARQHFATFTERFKGLPVRIAQASRLVARQGARRPSRPASRTAPSTSSSARTRCSARRSASSGWGC